VKKKVHIRLKGETYGNSIRLKTRRENEEKGTQKMPDSSLEERKIHLVSGGKKGGTMEITRGERLGGRQRPLNKEVPFPAREKKRGKSSRMRKRELHWNWKRANPVRDNRKKGRGGQREPRSRGRDNFTHGRGSELPFGREGEHKGSSKGSVSMPMRGKARQEVSQESARSKTRGPSLQLQVNREIAPTGGGKIFSRKLGLHIKPLAGGMSPD